MNAIDLAQYEIRRRWMETIPKALRPKPWATERDGTTKAAEDAAARRREMAPEVLRLKAEGKTNMWIGIRMGISDTTVKRIIREAKKC